MQTISIETRKGGDTWVANGIGAAMQIRHPDACEAVLVLDENSKLVGRDADPEVAVGQCIEQAVENPLSGLTLSPDLRGLPARALGHLAIHDGMPGVRIIEKGQSR
jgi:hypothetical protein